MSPRPIYRWKSLWLGLFVLVFLGWAWARSMNRVDRIQLTRLPEDTSSTMVEWTEGRIVISEVDFLGTMKGGVNFSTYDLPDARRGRQPFFLWSDRESCFVIPFSPMGLAFLVGWGCWLFFHWKREQRKLTT